MTEAGAETFSLLGNETRLRIIEALGDLSEPGEFSTVSYSCLHEATDVEDSGTFSYHLGKLTDRFVHSIEDGYRLSVQGINVYRGLRAGIFYPEGGGANRSADDRVGIGLPCQNCDGELSLWAVDGRLNVGCGDCGGMSLRYPVPAGGLERVAEAIEADDGETAYAVLRERVVLDYLSMVDGFCPYCSGGTRVELREWTPELPEPRTLDVDVAMLLTCEYCHWYLHGNLEEGLYNHPMTVPFLQFRDVDVFEDDVAGRCDLAVTVHSRDPWRIEATVTLGDDRLVLELDGSLDATSARVERVDEELDERMDAD